MIRTVILLIYNAIRIAYNKLRFGKRFNVHIMQRISPMCALKLYSKGYMQIERNCEFAHGCDFQVHGIGKLHIGTNTYFNRYCMISAHESVKIGNNCMFGPGVKVFDNNHRFTKNDGVLSTLKCGEITIGNNCWIAANAVILKGTTIGDNCVIGAGCLVQGNVPNGTLVKCKQELIFSEIK